MKSLGMQRSISTAVLLGALTMALLVSPHGLFVPAGVAGPTAAAAAGFGFWNTISCLACISAFIIGAGTTIAGLAVYLAANPEIAILCTATCHRALT